MGDCEELTEKQGCSETLWEREKDGEDKRKTEEKK